LLVTEETIELPDGSGTLLGNPFGRLLEFKLNLVVP
jgi:hypothetical protein